MRENEVHPWVRKISWRRKWQPTPVFLPGESHAQRSLAGYSPWGHKELTWLKWLNTHPGLCSIQLSLRFLKSSQRTWNWKSSWNIRVSGPCMAHLFFWVYWPCGERLSGWLHEARSGSVSAFLIVFPEKWLNCSVKGQSPGSRRNRWGLSLKKTSR